MGSRTFFPIIALVILGCIAACILPFILSVLNFPGKSIIAPGRSGKCHESRFAFGVTVTVFLQSCVYLVYTAFVVHWTLSAMKDHGANFFVLFASIFAVFFPLGFEIKRSRAGLGEAERLFRKDLSESAQNRANERERGFRLAFRASSATFLLTVFVFVVFALFPGVWKAIHGPFF